jgi:hypothetical protein
MDDCSNTDWSNFADPDDSKAAAKIVSVALNAIELARLIPRA